MIGQKTLRQPPCGLPVMHQVWDKLLFLHWPVPVATLRPLLPESLEIDTFEDKAWIGITPFTIRGMRPPFFPSLPLVSTSHEMNMRTYVRHDGVPGVWFCSLDATNLLAVWGARMGFTLPYYLAEMTMETNIRGIHFQSRRVTTNDVKSATLEASWTPTGPTTQAKEGTLEYFLMERYCLYGESGGTLYRGRIHHQPWTISSANLNFLESTMFESLGLASPLKPPLVHALAEPLDVRIWYLERIRTSN